MLLLGLLGVGEAQAQTARTLQENADPVRIDSVVSLNTTYVFRGNLQYSDEEIPSLQLNLNSDYFVGRRGFVWGWLWAGTALDERETNAELGSRDEFDLGGGYGYWLRKDMELRLGGIAYLRPENTPTDIREEVVGTLTWVVYDDQDIQFVPYARVYGEVHRMLGVYGEAGFDVVRWLGFGFYLRGNLTGGASTYYRDNVEDFNAFSFQVELAYNFISDWTVSGQFNGAVTNDVTEISTDFLEKYGTFWSGLKLRYSPRF
ncbi:MAG: hypothetical protein CMH57_06215 [Myxococcales bacterium]|nr:hypothetical protein [Myxococcales bacterium]